MELFPQSYHEPYYRSYLDEDFAALAAALLIAAAITQWWWFIALAFLQGYALAWIGHYFFEHNKPATFEYPLFSLMGDWRLWGKSLSAEFESKSDLGTRRPIAYFTREPCRRDYSRGVGDGAFPIRVAFFTAHRLRRLFRRREQVACPE